MKAVVLAAGRSTRLRPLTNDLPKPMLPVNNKPMLEYVIRLLRINEFTDLLITTHYKAGKIKEYFGDGSDFGVRINYSYEEILLDTAGSLKLNEAYLERDFLVVGANLLLPTINLKKFVDFFYEKGGIGSIALKYIADQELLANFGQAVLDTDNRVVCYKEKPEQLLGNFVHSSYQIYSPKIFEYIPENTPYAIPTLIPEMIALGQDIYGFVSESDLLSVSTFELYQEANEKMKSQAFVSSGVLTDI